MSGKVVALAYASIGFNVYLVVVFAFFDGTAIPWVSDSVLACVFFASFLVLLVVQMLPRFEFETSERIWLTILSLLYIPATIIIFAFVYRGLGINGATERMDYLYFSVVTFTTLGYGDLLPKGEARVFSSLQAITGFLFMPLLISLLINTFKEASDDYKALKRESDQAAARKVQSENE